MEIYNNNKDVSLIKLIEVADTYGNKWTSAEVYKPKVNKPKKEDNTPKIDNTPKKPVDKPPKKEHTSNAAIVVDNPADECEYHVIIGQCKSKDCKKKHTDSLIGNTTIKEYYESDKVPYKYGTECPYFKKKSSCIYGGG